MIMKTDKSYPKELDPVNHSLKTDREISQMSMIMNKESRSSIGTAGSDVCVCQAKTSTCEEMGQKVAMEAAEERSDEITTSTIAISNIEKGGNPNIEERTETSPSPIDDFNNGNEMEENCFTRVNTAASSTISLMIDAFIPLTRINTTFDSQIALQQNDPDASADSTPSKAVPEWCKNRSSLGEEEKISLPNVSDKQYLTALEKNECGSNRNVEVEMFDLEGREHNIALQKSPTYPNNRTQEDGSRTVIEMERNRTVHPNIPPTKATRPKKRTPRMRSASDMSKLVDRERAVLHLAKTRTANPSEPLTKDASENKVMSPRKQIIRAMSSIEMSAFKNDSMKIVKSQTAPPRAVFLTHKKTTVSYEEESIVQTRCPKILNVASERIPSCPRKPITKVTSNMEQTSSATRMMPLVKSRMASPIATMLKDELPVSTGAARFKEQDLDLSVKEGFNAESYVTKHANPVKEFKAHKNKKSSDTGQKTTLQNIFEPLEKISLEDEKLGELEESGKDTNSEIEGNVEIILGEDVREKERERRRTEIDTDGCANVPALGEFIDAEKAWIRQSSSLTSGNSEIISMGAATQTTQKISNTSGMVVVAQKKETAVTFFPMRKAKSKIKSKHRKIVVISSEGLKNTSDKKILKVEMKKKKVKDKVLKATPILRGKSEKKKGKSGLKMW